MKTGVGLILTARSTGRMLVLKELKSKPEIEKIAGMVSFPLETMKNGESKEAAISRLVDEEIGSAISEKPVFFGGTFSIVQNANTLAAYAFCDEEFTPKPADDDVEFYGWLHPDELIRPGLFVRKEVGPIMEAFALISEKDQAMF